MKALPCIPLLFTTLAWADTTADRAAIERVVGAVIAGQTGPGAKTEFNAVHGRCGQ